MNTFEKSDFVKIWLRPFHRSSQNGVVNFGRTCPVSIKPDEDYEVFVPVRFSREQSPGIVCQPYTAFLVKD